MRSGMQRVVRAIGIASLAVGLPAAAMLMSDTGPVPTAATEGASGNGPSEAWLHSPAAMVAAAISESSTSQLAGAAAASDALLLTEVVVTPTGGEFVEIHNPTPAAIDLSDVYLTDATFAPGGSFYYNIVTGANAGGGGFSDFHARFPDGASIAAGAFQTVAMAGSDDFAAAYGFDPDYELFEDGAAADGVADMREALAGSINNQGGLTNSGEVVVLYAWDGESDLVADLDYALWGDAAEAVDKTGVSIDGPDADTTTSTYLDDTAVAAQDVIAPGSHAAGNSFQRLDFDEGDELQSGGNGIGGSDETSENLSQTWAEIPATPGAGPPPPSAWVINEIHADPAAGDPAMPTATAFAAPPATNSSSWSTTPARPSTSRGGHWPTVSASATPSPPAPWCPTSAQSSSSAAAHPTGGFGNALVQTAATGSLGLNNGGDSLTLNDGAIDQAVAGYGSEGGDNQSLTLDPDIVGALPRFDTLWRPAPAARCSPPAPPSTALSSAAAQSRPRSSRSRAAARPVRSTDASSRPATTWSPRGARRLLHPDAGRPQRRRHRYLRRDLRLHQLAAGGERRRSGRRRGSGPGVLRLHRDRIRRR